MEPPIVRYLSLFFDPDDDIDITDQKQMDSRALHVAELHLDLPERAGDLRDLGVRLALGTQQQHLPPQLEPNIGTGASSIRFGGHAASSHHGPQLSSS